MNKLILDRHDQVTRAIARDFKIALTFLVGAIVMMAVSLFLLWPAGAADLPPIKAPAKNFFAGYPYWGLFTEGGGGSVTGNVSGVNPNALVTNQIGLGAAIGYIWADPTSPYFYAVEGHLGYRNFNATQPGLSLTGPMFGDVIFEAGVPTNALVALFPNLTNTRTSLFGGLHIDDISTDICGAVAGCGSNRDFRFAPEVGAALTGQVSNGTVVKTWVKTIFPDKGACVGPGSAVGCGGIGQQFLVGAGVFF
jgi:hypothetical protein